MALIKKIIKKETTSFLSLEETKRRRFIWSSPQNQNPPILEFKFAAVLGEGGGGGGGGRLVASESSLLTVVATAAGDEPFGPTTDRGNDDDNGDAATCYKWVACHS